MNAPTARLPVAVLGATGAVGQRFIQLLENHPWFKVVALTGSDRALGQKYGEGCRWILPGPIPAGVFDLPILPTLPPVGGVSLVFSALPSKIAHEAEAEYAPLGIAVFSNASAYRQETDVPLLLPEVNPDHSTLVHLQRRKRGWSGLIATNPNCTITGLTITLKPLLENFGVRRAFIVSMQAVSGAGYPGVPSMDILGNVVPYIADEEDKMEWEPLKMLGALQDGQIIPAPINISAHANRVPILEGHMLCLSVELAQKANLEEVAQALVGYQAPEISRQLPSTPPAIIRLSQQADRPQPRLDVMSGNGMTTVVGRLRPDPLLHYKMVILSHNTIRGAAGGSIYNAELLLKQGLVG